MTAPDIIMSPDLFRKMEKDAAKEAKQTKAEKKAAEKKAKQQKKEAKKKKKEAEKAAKKQKKEAAKAAKAKQKAAAKSISSTTGEKTHQFFTEVNPTPAETASVSAFPSMGIVTVVILLTACLLFMLRLRSRNKN